MALRIPLCPLADAPEEGYRVFSAPGLSQPVLLARVDGELRASSGICPHEDVELEGGDLDGELIVCPGHGYEFSLHTGKCVHDATLNLPTYRVTVEDGTVYVQLI